MSKNAKMKYDGCLDYHELPHHVAITELSGGISLDGGGERALRRAVNMMPVSKDMGTVAAPEKAFSELPEGELHGSICRGGLWLFGKGGDLFALCDGVLSRVGERGLLADGPCGIYETEKGFAVISGDSVFFVDRSLNVTFPEMTVPVLMDRVTPDGLSYRELSKPYFFCPYIDLIFKSDSNVGSAVYTVPPMFSVTADRCGAWYADTGEPVQLIGNPEIGSVRLWAAVTRAVRIRFRLSDDVVAGKISYGSMAPDREMLARVREPLSLSFPDARLSYLVPDTRNGRRLQVLALNEEADFCSLSESRLFGTELSEQITGVTEYGDGLLVFTDGAVRRCHLTLAEGVLDAELRLIKGDFGSDMPNSICRVDDKIIFASSGGGIFYLMGYGGEDREVCHHVSRPIEAGEEGFFSHTASEYHSAAAVYAFGKYYLTVGDMTYVWDIASKPPRASVGFGEESDMVFSLLSAISPQAYLAVMCRGLYYAEKDSGRLCRYTPEGSETAAVLPLLETAETDFMDSRKKVLLSLTAEYTASGEVAVELLYDGQAQPTVFSLPRTEGRRRIVIKLPQVRFYRCAVRLSAESAFSLTGLIYTYLPAEIA